MHPVRVVCGIVVGTLAVFSMFSGCDWGPVRIYVQSDATVAFGDRGGHHGFDGAVPDDVATGDVPTTDDSGADAQDAGGGLDVHALDAGTDAGGADGGAPNCPAGKPGDVLFTFQADARIVSTPAIGADGTIFFGSTNATFYAVGCDGRLKWQWKCPCDVQAFEGSPAIGTVGTVYIADDTVTPNYLFALNPDGSEKWRYEANGVNSEMNSSPALAGDGTIYIGQGGATLFGAGGALLAVDPDGKVKPGFPVIGGAVFASSATSGGIVFATDVRGQQGVDRGATVFAVKADGTFLWRTDLPADWEGSSIAVGGQGYVYTGIHYSGADPVVLPPEFAVVDASTGQIARRVPLAGTGSVVGSPVVGDSAFGDVVFAMLSDGRLVSTVRAESGDKIVLDLELGDFGHGSPVLGDDGFVYAAVEKDDFTYAALVFKVSGDGKEQIAQFIGDRISSSLAMGNGGVIYFGTESGKLIAVASGATGLDKKAPWPVFRHDGQNTGNADYVPKHLYPCNPEEQLWTGLSPMYSTGDISYSETVQVTFKGISLPGGTCNLMYFDAWGSEHRMEFCYNLPFGYEIPAAEGETVKLVVEQKTGGEAIYQKVFLWDSDQELRFQFYSGDPAVFDPVECADPQYCPVVSFADAVCTPEEDQCGKAVHPPVKFWMGGLTDECSPVLQQGESRVYSTSDSRCTFIERRRLMAVRSMKMIENTCDDHPDAWLSALILDNRKVSQCMCQDHDDCAEGDVCETEVLRCMRAVPPEVPCQPGDDADPYTGDCVRPADPPNKPCKGSADCAASGTGVCNTYWKQKYGTGFCQPNPCPSMLCAGSCSPLAATCLGCLSDCDCYVPEGPNGKCDLVTRTCNPQ